MSWTLWVLSLIISIVLGMLIQSALTAVRDAGAAYQQYDYKPELR